MINIKDIFGNIRYSTPINEGSKRKYLLMKEDYITLKFSLDDPVHFKLGDGIDNELGVFELVDLYKPAYNTSTGGYDYELRLDAYYWKWKNKKFFYTPESTGREASWNLTATLDVHLKVFLDNLKSLGYKYREEDFKYEIDTTVENTSKLVSYDSVNLIDALTQMAETWECEWWITDKTIHFGRCEYSSPVDFKAGDLTDTENVNVNSMTRSDSQTTYATRVYAFGSTRNIPSTYRKNLIFDVKQVNGREISDTARPLDIKYFPGRVVHKEEYPVNEGIGSGAFTASYTEWTHDTDIVASLPSGDYKVSSGDGISINVSTVIPSIGAGRSFLPVGDYVLKASYIYKVSGSTKEVSIGNQTVTLDQDQQYEVSVAFAVSSSLQIEGNATDLKIRIYVRVPSRESSILNDSFSAYVSYDITLFKGSSADATVTFLSGLNSGNTFSCVYNPDHLTGDSANVIQLPSGVTASFGDRYTIDNIIKGKVPDSYFSKDDKELTLNGVVQKRLMLPEEVPYVDAYRYSPTGERINIGDENYDDPDNVEMPEEEAIEEIVIFEDEYPKYIGSTVVVPAPTWEDEKVDDKPTGNKYPIYTFKDTGLKNFTEDFRLNGEELHMIFQTGKLAGMDFAINIVESDNTGTTFEILHNEDYGRALPDDALFPQAAHTEDGKDVPADTYVLYGFDTAFISEQMLPDAGQELLKKTKEHVKKSMIDPSTYDCEMKADFIYNNGNIRTYEAGDKINLINRAYFPNGRQSRIIGFEWPLDIPYDHPIYTIGETAAYSRIGEIESRLDNLTYKGHTYSGSAVGGGGTGIYVIGVNDKTLPSDRSVFSAKRSMQEHISKKKDDTASGLITFLQGLVSETVSIFRKGVRFGDFVTGMIGGSGGAVTVEEKTGKTIMEIDKAIFREELVVPKITFNCIDVISGDKANTFAFGTIRSVDTANRIIELDLLEGQTGTPKVNDICRGVFHKLESGNKTSDSADANGFLNYSGFATTYFTPSEILLNEPGAMKFKYTLQPGTTVHPSSGMNFYAYGNFTDETRQAMTYETRYYTRRLKNVDTWVIDPTRNISMQDGLLEGLTIGGFVMHGHGTFQENTYLTGPNIQFTPSQIEELQGKSAYNVSLSSYERVVKLDSAGNLTSLYEELNVISGNQNIVSGDENVVTSVYNLSTRIQAFKGETELLFSESVDKDRYVVVVSATGCRASVAAGILTITEVTNYEECYVDLKINCEGNAVFDKRFSVVVVRNGADGEGSITADFSDEMQSVSCSADGTVTSGLPLTSTFSMYYSSTKLTLDSLSRGSVPGVTVTTDKDTGIVTVTAITKDAADTLRLPVTGKATYNGVQYERTIHLSINKVKPGADGNDGANAVIYSLQPSTNVIKKDKDGNSDTTNISCRILKTDGSSTVVSSRPSGYSLDYIIDSGTPKSYTPGSNIAISGITKDITFRMYAENSSGITLVDQETIPVVQDGKNGVDGTDGHSPYISENGTWMVWDADQGKYVDSGDPAKGDDGHSPKIQNGTWWVWDAEQGKYIDTGIKAKGEDGDPGTDGRYTELRYRYAFDKPAAPAGVNPAGWFLSPEPKDLSFIRHTGDFILTDNMYISPTPASDSATYKERITFVTSYENQVIDLFLSVSSEAGDFGLVCPIDVAYTDNVTALWRKSGIVSETLSITVPFSGSHFIDIVYKKDSSLSRNEDRMKYQVIYPRTCWLSTSVINPNTNASAWSAPVLFPTDTPENEQVYLLSKSHIVVDFPSSAPYTDEYIGEAPAYDSKKAYVRGNIVRYNNNYRVCLISCTGIAPDTSTNWEDIGWWTDNPSGAGEAFPYEYQCSRKFTDGKWDNYENTILFTHFAKDGTDGNDGITPVVTQLIPSVTQIGRTMTGSYEPESFTVSHKDTEGTLVNAYMAVWGSNDGNSWTRIGSVENVSSKSINVARYPYKYFVVRTYGTSSASFGSDYLLSTSVSVLHDGEKGESGAQGAMPVYCGFYESGVGYTYTDATRDIINYNIDGGVFTFQVKVHGAVVTTPPTSSTGDANWEPAGKFKFVAMDTALIDGANIAGFMYKNLLMKSRLGLLRGTETDIKDVGESDMQWFKPYLQLDGNAGYIDAMANVRVAYQIIDAGTDLKKNLSWMVLNASGYNRINNLGNPDTGIGLQIYMHELGSQVFIGNFYSYALYVFLNVQLSNDVTYANSITTVKIKIPAGKMFRGVVIPNALTYRNGGVTVIEQDGTEVHYPFSLCIYPYSELSYIGVTGNYNNIPYYEVVH